MGGYEKLHFITIIYDVSRSTLYYSDPFLVLSELMRKISL